MGSFQNLSSEELILLASSLAIAISSDKTTDELNVLSVFFSALGDNIGIIAATRNS